MTNTMHASGGFRQPQRLQEIYRRDLFDHGYIQLIEHWGSEEQIIESARMSTAKGFRGWGPKTEYHCLKCDKWVPEEDTYDSEGSYLDPETAREARKRVARGHFGKSTDTNRGCFGKLDDERQVPGDEKLLRFMWENGHGTPFEMAGFTIEVKAPIETFRQWHRHRVPFGYNEMSARYVPLPDENYLPEISRVITGAREAGKNKQAQGIVPNIPSAAQVAADLDVLKNAYDVAQKAYERLLASGWPKELARLPVPVARYSAMRATSNLRGWLAFMKERCAPAAQEEIRTYANEVSQIVKLLFPRTHELFMEGMR